MDVNFDSLLNMLEKQSIVDFNENYRKASDFFDSDFFRTLFNDIHVQILVNGKSKSISLKYLLIDEQFKNMVFEKRFQKYVDFATEDLIKKANLIYNTNTI